jgi:hypothetical protein
LPGLSAIKQSAKPFDRAEQNVWLLNAIEQTNRSECFTCAIAAKKYPKISDEYLKMPSRAALWRACLTQPMRAGK